MKTINKTIKKIAVLGKGTAGCLTASILKKHTPAEIEWIYDPNTPTQSVGEGSTLPLAKNLGNEIQFDYDTLKQIGGSLKKGIKKIGWGGSGNFFHSFPIGSVAIHFSSEMLQNLISQNLLKKGVKIIDKYIKTYDEIDADYIVDCTGKPKSFKEYNKAQHIAVNAVHIVQSPCKGPLFDYTFTVARPYGWVFAIPLANRVSCGYLYNENINSLDEIKEDMKKFMAQYKFSYSENINNISFQNYYKKENFTERVMFNGNASFFLEPLEATSIACIYSINSKLIDIINNSIPLTSANLWYEQLLIETQHMIGLHYYSGSKYNSSFWDYAKKKGIKSVNEMITSNKFRQIAKGALFNIKNSQFSHPSEEFEYGSWPIDSYHQNFVGLGIVDQMNNLIKNYEK